MLLIIDNYDSFTFNLVQYFQELGQAVKTFRHDEITLKDCENLHPDYIVISPGPGNPNDAGISLNIIERFKGLIPILGVCLGHQCIAAHFGAKIIHANHIMHGKTSFVEHNDLGVFKSCPKPLRVTRYHSLVIDPNTLSDDFIVTAKTLEKDGKPSEIMGIKHKTLPLEGVQFHPESILTQAGHQLLGNFLNKK